jgi:rSAM/selenodomain-associated transferase 1
MPQALQEVQLESMNDLGFELTLIMCRAPSSRAKTRLAPVLRLEQRQALVEAMLRDVVDCVQCLSSPAVRLLAASSEDAEVLSGLPWVPPGVVQVQEDGSLGDRLKAGVCAALAAGYRRILVMGSDAPSLPLALLERLGEALQQSTVGFVAAEDGGYVALGLKDPGELTLEGLFDEIPWSTSAVLQTCLERLRVRGVSAQVVGSWFDVDEGADLKRLSSAMPGPKGEGRRTLELLHSWHVK